MKKMIFCSLWMILGCAALYAHDHKKINPGEPALPVKETYVPDDVMTKLSRQYGPDLYSITCVKGKNGDIEYWIRTKSEMKMTEAWIPETAVYAMK